MSEGTWQSPTGHTDPDNKWANEANCYDGNIGTWATNDTEGYYLELNQGGVPFVCDKVRVFCARETGGPLEDTNLDIDVHDGIAWQNVFSGIVDKETRVTISFSPRTTTKVRIKVNDDISAIYPFLLNEFELFVLGKWRPYGFGIFDKTRMATVYTVPATRHITHVHVALSLFEYGYHDKGKCVENTVLEWELREGASGDLPGLNGSSKVAEGSWAISDRTIWPLWELLYRTAHFSPPVLHDSTKYYFFVIKVQDEGAPSLFFPVWWELTGDSRNTFIYESPTWYNYANVNVWIDAPTDQAGIKYHLVIDGKGYMTPDNLGSYNKRLATQFGAVLRGGQSRHSQLTYPYSSFSQDTFRHGMGWTYFEDPQTFYFGENVDPRVEGQVILAPRKVPAPLAGIAEYHVAEDREEIDLPWSAHSTRGKPVLKIAQRVYVSTSLDWQTTWLAIRKEFRQPKFGTTLTFKIWADNAGEPGSTLQSIEITNLNSFKWHSLWWVEINHSDISGPLDAYYWLGLEISSTEETPMWSVTADPSASFAQAGKTTEFKYYYDGAWVEDIHYDLQFFMNYGAFPVGEAFFAEFEGALYAAAGHSIYKWDETDGEWDAHLDGSGYGGDCTGLINFSGKLWAAWGDAHVVKSCSDGVSWSDEAYEAKRFYVAQGYLWRSDSTAAGQHKCYKSNDGTTWSAAISVGEVETAITGFCLFNNVVVVSKADGLWYIDADDLAHSYFNYEDQEYCRNGENLKVWSNNVYIPILSGLWRWTGSSVDTLGPDRRAGLPKWWEGYIRDIISCANWMFVAVDGGSSAWSTVLCYNGIGWLPFVRGQHFGSSIRKLHLTSTIGNELRLWIMEGKHCFYCRLPYTRENHYEWDDARYAAEGSLITSWWNGGLFNALKYFKDIILECDGLVESGTVRTWIDVWYQINGNEDLTTGQYYLGRVTPNNETALRFPQELVAYSIRLIFKLGSTNAKYTPRIKSYNVDCIVRPDPSYVTSFAVSIADNLVLMDKNECAYTAQELWEHLQITEAKKHPIIISTPWETIYGFISALQTRTRQYKEHGEPKWEQTALVSIVEG